ncbi:MAG: hypothetical protein J3R72DRAFT_433293 [Linnemannia gamsii]|nr:MAG: hypothetical protein J3R72DRAFT_433293 [Linnemannia gamsii]
MFLFLFNCTCVCCFAALFLHFRSSSPTTFLFPNPTFPYSFLPLSRLYFIHQLLAFHFSFLQLTVPVRFFVVVNNCPGRHFSSFFS